MKVDPILSVHGLYHGHLVRYQSLFVDDRPGTAKEARHVPPGWSLIHEYLLCVSHCKVNVETIRVSKLNVILMAQQGQSFWEVQALFLTGTLFDVTVHQLTQAGYNGIVRYASLIIDKLGCSVQISV